jgi:hypothetical protein
MVMKRGMTGVGRGEKVGQTFMHFPEKEFI